MTDRRLWRCIGVALGLMAGQAAGEEGHFREAPYQQIVAGVHFDSVVSGGPLSIVDLARKAKQHGLDVAIMTDRDQAEIEYGAPLLRNILKYRYVLPSIRTLGADRYLQQIRDAEAAVPGIMVIPGAECMPYYFWRENTDVRVLAKRKLRDILALRNAHVHLTAIGLDHPTDYDNIPSLATGYPVTLDSRLLWLIAYLALIWIGLKLREKRRAHRDGVRFYVGSRSRGRVLVNNMITWSLVLLGVLLIVNDVVWPPRMYSQYQTNLTVEPIQRFIDYVEKERGGMVFWAHPEVEQDLTFNGIRAYTPAYHDFLLQTRGYTGFAIFWEGMRVLGRPEGKWDLLLTQYCAGRRPKPVWCLGELDYESDWAEDAIRETVTILLLKKRSDLVRAAFERGAAAGASSAAGSDPAAAALDRLDAGGLPKPLRYAAAAALKKSPLTECTLDALTQALKTGGLQDYTHGDVLDALRTGKMYAARNFSAQKLRIDDFHIEAHDGAPRAYSGDTLTIEDAAVGHLKIRAIQDMADLRFVVVCDRQVDRVFPIRQISKGEVVPLTFQVPAPVHRPTMDMSRQVKSFYRVLGYEGAAAVIATNPIFVAGATEAADEE